MDLVYAPPYYQDPTQEWYEKPGEEFVDMSGQPSMPYQSETNSMMLVGPLKSRPPPHMQ